MDAQTTKIQVLVRALKSAVKEHTGDTRVLEDDKTSEGHSYRYVQIQDCILSDGEGRDDTIARFTGDQVDIVRTVTEFNSLKPLERYTQHVEIGAGEMTALALAWLEWFYSE